MALFEMANSIYRSRMLKNTEDGWGRVARGMHSLGILLMLVLIVHGWWMTEFPPRAERFAHYGWHGSVGYSMLLLAVLRLGWRQVSPPPPAPVNATRNERNLAWLGHAGLYFLTFACAIQGWALAGTFSQPLNAKLLGFIPMPMIASGNALHEILEEMHVMFAWMLAALVVLHIAAAVYHVAVKKDDVMKRMFG
jgi:cytochrome b561